MNPVGNTDYGYLDSNTLPQRNSHTQLMVAFACQLIKSVSEPLGFDNVTQMARSAAYHSHLLVGAKMLHNGELGKMYVHNSPSSQNAEDRATFWRTIQIYITLSRPILESMHNVIAVSLPQVARFVGSSVNSLDLAVGLTQKAESSFASMETFLQSRYTTTHEKVSKIADIIHTASTFAAHAIPLIHGGLITTCGVIAAMAGVVKVFSMFINNSKIFQSEFHLLKEDVMLALQQQVSITGKYVEQSLGRKAEYDITERGNFKDNLAQVRQAQNAIELCKAVNIFIRDFTQSEEVFLSSNEESVSSEQVEIFFSIQSKCERAALSAIDVSERQLVDYLVRLETLLTAQSWTNESNEAAGIVWQKKMQDEMQQIRAQLDAVHGRAQTLVYHSTGLTLPREKNTPLDIEAWLKLSIAILNPEREKTLEELAVELSALIS